MSATAPLEVDEELDSTFKRALEGDSVGVIQVQVKAERFKLSSSHSPSGSTSSDFDFIGSVASEDEASYFLIKLKSKEWLLVTYVPDSVAVKDKMVYASAKGTLKDKFGHAFVTDEFHATSKDELLYEHFKGTQKPSDARSAFEIEREKVLEEEDEAREEIVQKMAKVSTSGFGGYHSVTIPLSTSAKSALDRLKSGEVNFVALAVDESQSSIICGDSKNVDVSNISREMHTAEPRFYLYSSQSGKPIVFIYSCPGKAPPKLRMVYSTSKPNVINQITQYGLNLATKKIEITEGEDLLDELKEAQSSTTVKPSQMGGRGSMMTGRMIAPAPGSTPAFGGTVKASKLPTMNAQHGIYGLMAKPGTEGSTTKKENSYSSTCSLERLIKNFACVFYQ